MPGARELRELCQALQVSPNKLLFGSEVPFKEQSFADAILDSEPEDEHVVRARTAFLLGLVSSDERHAVATLIRSLALSRHGEAKVKEVMQAADLSVGMFRGLIKSAQDAATAKGSALPEEMAKAAGDELEKFMERNGHSSNPKKLPKK
jgi:hypothetical protein